MAYFDHAATTPMRQCAIEAWTRHASMVNPSGSYAAARKANAVLSTAREKVAELIGADPAEVVFVGSGTEADNTAVRGLYHTRFKETGLTRVVAPATEHNAVIESVKHLAAEHGAKVEWMPVDRNGVVADFSAVDSPAAVATCMLANNETGVIQPVAELAARAAAAGTPLHVDAVQAVGKIPVNFRALGATTLAASAHKFGGPRGSGILVAKRSPAPHPLVVGGGQERGLRSGTVDVASAAATAAALEEAVTQMDHERSHLRDLSDALLRGIVKRVPDTVVTTTAEVLPGHVHVMFPGASADALLMMLDRHGIGASAGSACSAGVQRLSHVLEEMGVDRAEGMGALRLTLGRTSTREEVDGFLEVIGDVVERARIAGSL